MLIDKIRRKQKSIHKKQKETWEGVCGRDIVYECKKEKRER